MVAQSAKNCQIWSHWSRLTIWWSAYDLEPNAFSSREFILRFEVNWILFWLEVKLSVGCTFASGGQWRRIFAFASSPSMDYYFFRWQPKSILVQSHACNLCPNHEHHQFWAKNYIIGARCFHLNCITYVVGCLAIPFCLGDNDNSMPFPSYTFEHTQMVEYRIY